MFIKAESIIQLQREITRLQARLRSLQSYKGADIDDLRADVTYELECRKDPLSRLVRDANAFFPSNPRISVPNIGSDLHLRMGLHPKVVPFRRKAG